MNSIFTIKRVAKINFILATLSLSILPMGLNAQAPGTEAIYGGSLGVVNITVGNTQTDVAETIYIGPGIHVIDGTWDIYSKRVWVSPNANLTGSGQIVFHNSTTTPGGPGAGGSTVLDANLAGFNANIVHANNQGLVMQDFPKPSDPVASTWHPGSNMYPWEISKNLDLAVDGADIWLVPDNGDWAQLRFTATGTISGYSAQRMIITNNELRGVIKIANGAPFTFPIGIADGDYTPVTIDFGNTNINRSYTVSVVDYSCPYYLAATISAPEEGMDRAWSIAGYVDSIAGITAQHNIATNGSLYDDATAYITNLISLCDGYYDEATDTWYPFPPEWNTSSTPEYVSPGLHTSTYTRTLPMDCNTEGARLSFFTKSSDPLSPLPVKLIGFEVFKQNSSALLKWATASEQNNKGFEIERSTDGSNWRRIGFENSKAVNGNSNTKLQYHFVDNTPVNGQNFYRLKQIDFDGKYAYSSVRTVHFNSTNSISIFPNPVIDRLTISGMPEGNTAIKIMDVQGKLLKTINADNSIQNIDFTDYAAGIYFLKIVKNTTLVGTYKFVKK